jgi:hypothetical protein
VTGQCCIQYELAERMRGMTFGGIGSMMLLVRKLGLSNRACMIMTALAWNLKIWWALYLPERDGQRGESQRQEKHRVLRMEFKKFLNAFMRLSCQIVFTSRCLIDRLLGWNPWSGVFFRLVDRLDT